MSTTEQVSQNARDRAGTSITEVPEVAAGAGQPLPTTVALLADEEFAATFGPRVVSTSLALAWVASGRRAGYVSDGHLHGSVHFTAGIALCVAAGCVVTNLEGGPIHTGVGGLIAAADTTTHSALLAMTTRQIHKRI